MQSTVSSIFRMPGRRGTDRPRGGEAEVTPMPGPSPQRTVRGGRQRAVRQGRRAPRRSVAETAWTRRNLGAHFGQHILHLRGADRVHEGDVERNILSGRHGCQRVVAPDDDGTVPGQCEPQQGEEKSPDHAHECEARQVSCPSVPSAATAVCCRARSLIESPREPIEAAVSGNVQVRLRDDGVA